MKGIVGLIQADGGELRRTCKVGRKASSERERLHALISETGKVDVPRR